MNRTFRILIIVMITLITAITAWNLLQTGIATL